MHDVMSPHCGYCQHFEFCFHTDMVTEWGYCLKGVKVRVPSRREVDVLKQEVEAGSYGLLLTKAEEMGLFVPAFTDCKLFIDSYGV